ncbi:MAG TPA: hypothetical protein VHX66_01630 [Solirubrobacteraceae bacterium]|jgi:hypothetical protein|nr:hypothetical protein [Solirubrobacteraceae bacterium]
MRRIPIAIAVTAALALLPASASAGQIVWVKNATGGSTTLWAANDDGTYPHEIAASTTPDIATVLPGATIASPDLFQSGGSSVVFTAATNTFGAPGCNVGTCSLTFSLSGGVLARQSPLAPVLPTGDVVESMPRLIGAKAVAYSYSVFPGATQSAPGAASQTGIYTRALGTQPATAAGTPWSNTASETLAPLVGPAPDPANAALLAWVQNQDPSCTVFIFRSAAACQYAIHVGTAAATSAPPVAVFDDETPFGHGPSSLSWSSNGRTLLIVDDQAPNNGIYTVAASTAASPGTKTVNEVLAEPPGWVFGQARFAGSKIVFDAHGEGRSSTGTSDVYSISAGCDSGSCAFPLNASNLTRNAGADNVDPTWSSAAAPILGHGQSAPSKPSLLAAALRSRTVTAKQGVTFAVTLSASATLSLSVSSLGTEHVHHAAGEAVITVKSIGGHSLGKGHHSAAVKIVGSASGRSSYSTTVTVR